MDVQIASPTYIPLGKRGRVVVQVSEQRVRLFVRDGSVNPRIVYMTAIVVDVHDIGPVLERRATEEREQGNGCGDVEGCGD